MEAVLRMANLFKKFLLKIIPSQTKRFSLTVAKTGNGAITDHRPGRRFPSVGPGTVN